MDQSVDLRVVPQEAIELMVGFERLLRQRQQVYNRLYKKMMDMLLAGAEVETGAHTLQLGPGDQYLVIDGVPHTEFMPRVSPRGRQ